MLSKRISNRLLVIGNKGPQRFVTLSAPVKAGSWKNVFDNMRTIIYTADQTIFYADLTFARML